METRPLLTFAIFAYRQERYIREAVLSALAQTYTPLQIILSDDCSPDDTFRIIQEEVAAYQGPHEVTVNRMPKNVGVGRHVNHVMELAKGELIVIAAGDDISVPHRTNTIWEAWRAGGMKADSLYSAVLLIDEFGQEIGPLADFELTVKDILADCREGLPITGCAHAWTRRVFEKFGALREDLVYEDRGIALRSRLLGGIQFVPETLVKYRRMLNSLTFSQDDKDPAVARRKEMHLHACRMLTVYHQWEEDFAKADFPPEGWKEYVKKETARLETVVAILERGFFGRLFAFLGGLRRGVKLRDLWKIYLTQASRMVFGAWVRRNPKLRRSAWELEIERLRAKRKTTAYSGESDLPH